jgi:hypothetical protein
VLGGRSEYAKQLNPKCAATPGRQPLDWRRGTAQCWAVVLALELAEASTLTPFAADQGGRLGGLRPKCGWRHKIRKREWRQRDWLRHHQADAPHTRNHVAAEHVADVASSEDPLAGVEASSTNATGCRPRARARSRS